MESSLTSADLPFEAIFSKMCPKLDPQTITRAFTLLGKLYFHLQSLFLLWSFGASGVGAEGTQHAGPLPGSEGRTPEMATVFGRLLATPRGDRIDVMEKKV